MEGLNPWDITKLAEGPVRALRAPTSVAVPTKLQDFFALNSPYASKTDVVDFGAIPKGEDTTYERSFETEGIGIEQETSDIFTEITGTSRTFEVPIAEIEPVNIALVEGSEAAPEVIAAVKKEGEKEGTSEQEAVPLDAIGDLPVYRIMLVARRKQSSVLVTEKGGAKRGGFVAVVLNRCSLSADSASIAIGRGKLLSATVKFESFPDSSVEDGKGKYGRWIFENEDTIE